MRKISIFAMGLLAISGYNSIGQTVHPITVNVSELAELRLQHPPSKGKAFKNDNEAKENLFKTEQVMRDMPIPAGATIFKQAPTTDLPSPNSPDGLDDIETSPNPNITFEGSNDQGQTIPPDGGGAVGPNHVVTTLNDLFRFRSKTGVLLKTVAMNTFFDPTGARGFSDPHMRYDHFSNRWIACAITIDEATNNLEAVSVSATADPTGVWKTYYFESDPDRGVFFNDYPLMGFNQKWIAVSGNMFNSDPVSATNGNFEAVVLFVLDKAAMYAGADVTIGVNAARILATENGGGTISGGLAGNACPVIPLNSEAANAPMYIAQNWSGSLSTIRISSITGTLPNVSWDVNTATYYQGGTAWNHNWTTGSTANSAPQLGETRGIAQNDARINNAYAVNGSIWAAHAIFLTTPAQHSAIQWWQVNPTSGVVQRGRVDDATGARNRSFPSLVVNRNEDVLLGYATFQSTIYPSASYVFRSANLPRNQMDNEVVFKPGLGSYYKAFGGTRNRYGDYAPGALDPTDGSLWVMNHYAAARTSTADDGSRWGTWWAQVIPPSIAAVTNDVQLFSITEPQLGPYYCNNSVTPKIVIRNGSSTPLTSAKVNYRIDGGVINTVDFTGNLAQYQTATVTFPQITQTTGTHLFQVYTTLPNGGVDGRLFNDTVQTTFIITPTVAMPLVEGFTGAAFPPAGWSRINPDNDFTWQRDPVAGFTAPGSAWIDFWDYTSPNQRDQLRTPLLTVTPGVDSLLLSFAHSHMEISTYVQPEGLDVGISTDCGRSWTTAWSKTGVDLETTPPTDVLFTPTSASQWRKNFVDLSAFKGATSILVRFESRCNYGNNLFLDDINISGKFAAQRDLTIPAIISPTQFECNNPFIPQITIRQLGKATITTAKVSYQLDNGTVNSVNWTGSLGYGQSTNFSLPAITTTAGNHNLKIWTSLPNGLADEVPANDTAYRIGFAVFGKQADPLKEGFEGAIFPPAGWGVQNLDDSTTWARTILASKSGAASAFVNNNKYRSAPGRIGQVDLLTTPLVTPTANSDSMFLQFQLSAATLYYPGSTALGMDTLEILLTTDCGKTYTSVYKKWGAELQTISSPNSPNDPEFYPLTKNQWRLEDVNLTSFLTAGASGFQVAFRNVSNHGNNVFIDDVNLFTKQVPARLKAQGYLISPNPFENNFVIQHYIRPTDLKSVGVYNALGQLMQRMDFNGDANSYIDVNMSRFAAGMYTVQLVYTNRQVTQRIIKAK
ncbi:MAG: T9SS type A sorting domain-containing protein [Chitinophagaceae bacterium]